MCLRAGPWPEIFGISRIPRPALTDITAGLALISRALRFYGWLNNRFAPGIVGTQAPPLHCDCGQTHAPSTKSRHSYSVVAVGYRQRFYLFLFAVPQNELRASLAQDGLELPGGDIFLDLLSRIT